MTVIQKTIGRLPVNIGDYDYTRAYGKKNRVLLYGCEWESKVDNNTYAPAALNTTTGVITQDTTHWKLISGSYNTWLIDNGYQKMDATNVKDGNNNQHQINASFANEIGSDSTPESIKGRITNLEEAVGSGGSVDERIAEEGARHYLKSETYTKEEVNGLVSTPHQEYVTVADYASLPASGSTDTIYRVSNYDGTQVATGVYSEFAWDGTQYVFLAAKSSVDEVFDITVYNNNTKYADLAAALNGGGNIPQSLQKGGMSVKFVQSSDNKYVQYRLMADSFSTTESDWQGVDDEPTVGSNNLVKSGGVAEGIEDVKSLIVGEKKLTLTLLDNVRVDNGSPNGTIISLSTHHAYYCPITKDTQYLIEFIVNSDYGCYGRTDSIPTVGSAIYDFWATGASGSREYTPDADGYFVMSFAKSNADNPLTVKAPVENSVDERIIETNQRLKNVEDELYYEDGKTLELVSPYEYNDIFLEHTIPKGFIITDASVDGVYYFNYRTGHEEPVYLSSLPYVLDEDITRIRTSFSGAFSISVAKKVEEKNTISGVSSIIKEAASLPNNTPIVISDSPQFVKKNREVSFYCKLNSFDYLTVGKGVYDAYGVAVIVDTVSVSVVGYYGSTTTVYHNSNHGLNINTFIKVMFSVGNDGKLKFVIQSIGGMYSQDNIEVWYWGEGQPSATLGGSGTDAKLTITHNDMKCPVWVIGDSYVTVSTERWPYYVFDIGYSNFLLDGKSGGGSAELFTELNKMLAFGSPKYIVWCLGMNDSDANGSTVNASWNTTLNALKTLCENHSITLILTTIPNVPQGCHEAKNSIVRYSGLRYIDFAKAVNGEVYTEGTDNWYPGYLNHGTTEAPDNIHPTALGAQALATQVLIDFPEIMQYGIGE